MMARASEAAKPQELITAVKSMTAFGGTGARHDA
jgi:hypothetical protein